MKEKRGLGNGIAKRPAAGNEPGSAPPRQASPRQQRAYVLTPLSTATGVPFQMRPALGAVHEKEVPASHEQQGTGVSRHQWQRTLRRARSVAARRKIPDAQLPSAAVPISLFSLPPCAEPSSDDFTSHWWHLQQAWQTWQVWTPRRRSSATTNALEQPTHPAWQLAPFTTAALAPLLRIPQARSPDFPPAPAFAAEAFRVCVKAGRSDN